MPNDSFIEKLKAGLLTENASMEVIAFVLNNESLLVSLGAGGVSQVIDLMQMGKHTDAQLLLDAKMTADQIIARETMNAQELAADTAKREKFLRDLKGFAWQIAPLVFKLGLGFASGGVL